MSIHLIQNYSDMSILFSNFAEEIQRNTYRNINLKKLRPTRIRDKKMTHSITKTAERFINKDAALMAFMANQFFFIHQGFLTTSTVNLEVLKIELTVHFDFRNPPRIPEGYVYSQKEITSHTYYSDYERRLIYVRCLTLTFKF